MDADPSLTFARIGSSQEVPAAKLPPRSASLMTYLSMAQWGWAARNLAVDHLEAVGPEQWRPRPGDLYCVRIEQVGTPAQLALADGALLPLRPGVRTWMLWDAEAPGPDAGTASAARAPAVADVHAMHHVSGLFGPASRREAGEGTLVRPLARALRRDGRACNVRHGALAMPPWSRQLPPVLMVLPAHEGIAADSVMQVAARLVRQCTGEGIRIGALQLAGAGPEPGMARLAAAGAAPSLDLSQAGFCGTNQCSPPQLVRGYLHQLNLLAQAQVDLVLACSGEHALSRAVSSLLQSKALGRSLCGVCLVEDPADRRPPVAGSMFAALDVPMVIGHRHSEGAFAEPAGAPDELRELATLLHTGYAADFEVTRPSWWLA